MKVLLVSYYYPPMGGAGVQRGLKFSKYLPAHGVTPVVLACDDPSYVRDESLLLDVPAGLEVHRVEHSPWLTRLAAWRRTAAQTASAAAQRDRAPARPNADAGVGARVRGTLRDAVLRGVRTLQLPDHAAPWAARALPIARRVLQAHAARGEPVELVFSSAPPSSAHALGERIADEFGLPWVADFRDLWTDNPAYDLPAWRRAVDRRTEQRWLQRATGVVTVTPSWRTLLAARRPAAAPVAFIPNGYDEDDFADLFPVPQPPRVFTVVHTGTFYGVRDPAGLLEGLAAYLAGARQGDPALRVRLIGNMGARYSDAIAAFAQRHPGVVQTVPYLPHRQALVELVSADALLLVVGGGRGPAVSGTLPGKIFEYLRSGRPVLTLGDPAGDAAQIIRGHARGRVVASDDTAGIAAALGDLVAQSRSETMPSDESRSSARVFERRELARQLAAFMRQCRDLHSLR